PREQCPSVAVSTASGSVLPPVVAGARPSRQDHAEVAGTMNGKHVAMALLGATALVAAFPSMRGSFRPDSGREAVPGPDRRGGDAETVVAAAREPEAPGSTPAARTVVETSTAPATASLTGRCVDGEGRPLHGA